MASEEDYRQYLDRHATAGRGRKRLEQEEFNELLGEFRRLIRRIDPDDIQLDEWKRADELRFLLILPDEDEED